MMASNYEDTSNSYVNGYRDGLEYAARAVERTIEGMTFKITCNECGAQEERGYSVLSASSTEGHDVEDS